MMTPLQLKAWHNATVIMGFVALIMALVLILTTKEVLRIRSEVVRMQTRANLIQQSAEQSLSALAASCERGNSLRASITFLLNRYPDLEAIRLLKDPDLNPVDCLSIIKEAP
jgi:hypothetical protein